MNRCFIGVLTGAATLSWLCGLLRAETLPVPNASFESPTTSYVSVTLDSWQKTPKPDWYVESGTFLWSYNVGVFKNTPPTSTNDHIDNCDGDQAIWLFAVPEVGLFQDYDSVDWDDPSPTHNFNNRFEEGSSYRLAVGVIGSGGNMLPGVTLELSFYYRDATSNKVIVAATSITNSPSVFSNNTHLVDFAVTVPAVQRADAWAGQNIGIQFLSTVSSNLQGGYWDLDNVRLAVIGPPVLSSPVWTNNQFQFTLQSEPGLALEILASSNVVLAASNWTSLGTLTNVTGAISFIDTAAIFGQRFYQARQLP